MPLIFDGTTGISGVQVFAPATVGTTQLANLSVTGAKLENSGVTAGTLGSASAIPVVTVDAKGRVTALSTVSLPAPVAATVTSIVAGTAITASNASGAVTVNLNTASGIVGSYVYGTVGSANFGSSHAGSSICNLALLGSNTDYGPGTAYGLTGTWRSLSGPYTTPSTSPNCGGLFQRIA